MGNLELSDLKMHLEQLVIEEDKWGDYSSTACDPGEVKQTNDEVEDEGTCDDEAYYSDNWSVDEDGEETISESSYDHSPKSYYYKQIRWPGFLEETGPVLMEQEQECSLCKFGLEQEAEGEEKEDYGGFESLNLPTVAVLPCGHVYHAHCLQRITPSHLSFDPPCFRCAFHHLSLSNVNVSHMLK